MRLQPTTCSLTICFLLAFFASARAQTPRSSAPPSRTDSTTVPADDAARRMASEMAKKVNQERQAQLKSDTDRLLKLSQELKNYVDKSNENVLSVDVLKKADEIEKLARSVKDKMKGPN